jgi:hypothetical protein
MNARTCAFGLFAAVAGIASLRPLAAAPPQPSSGSTGHLVVAVVRNDGLLLPFAAFDGRKWSAPWPGEIGGSASPELPVSLGSVPPKWWAHGGLDDFHVECPAFTHHDVVRIVIDDRVAVLVERLEQPSFTDDEGRATRFLRREEPGGRHRAREDVFFSYRNAHAGELHRHVAARPLAVVGQKGKGNFAVDERGDESVRAGD